MNFKRLKMFLSIVAGAAAFLGSIAGIMFILGSSPMLFLSLVLGYIILVIWVIAGDLTK